MRSSGGNFPEVEIVYECFHLKQAVSRALDEVRREEGKERKERRATCYLWLKRPENLKESRRRDLEALLTSGIKTVQAYQLSLTFDSFFEVGVEDAEEYLYRRSWRVTHSRLSPMRRVAHIMRNHVLVHYIVNTGTPSLYSSIQRIRNSMGVGKSRP